MKELHNCSLERYNELKSSGMFWVWFPEATGTYAFDMNLAGESYLNDMELANKAKLQEESMTKESEYIWEDSEGDFSEEAIVNGNVVKLKAVKGYASDINTLVKLVDSGEGVSVKFNSLSFFDTPRKVKLSHLEAEYMYKVLHAYITEVNKNGDLYLE